MKKIHSVVIAMLAGCASHENCGENGASQYARFLEPRISCWDMRRGHESAADYALCQYSQTEEWLCSGEGWCRPLGPVVMVKRVQ